VIEAKRNDPRAEDKKFYFWDKAYYTDFEKKSTKLTGKGERSQKYFPLQQTLPKLLSALGALFGIVFEKVDGSYWHKDVELYAVWDDEDSGGGFSGYLFLYLYERDGKYKGSKYSLH
jgi:metallopeptidase MepB